MAIAAEVVHLLSEVDELGRRKWTTVSLGQACGGLRHETIRLARVSAGVGPAVHDGILRLTGLTMDQLLRKHHVDPGSMGNGRPGKVGSLTLGPASIRCSPKPSYSGAIAAPDRVALGRQAISVLQADGFERVDALHAVGQIVFSEEVVDILELYRKGRAILDARKAADDVRATRSPAPAPLKRRRPPQKKR